jgi:integrase
VLDMGEIKQIFDAASLIGFPFGHYVHMLALTAQRRTEVACMRWSEIDLDAATWTQSSGDNKSQRAHLVPLSAPAMAILEALPRLGDTVFSLDGEQRVLGYAKGKTLIDQFIATKGDALAPWRLHDLRRSGATHMVRLGVNETTVGRVLNHAPQGVTAKVYALHSYAPEKRTALDRWAAEIERTLDPAKAGNVVPLHG